MANTFMFGTPSRFERTSKYRPESEGVLDTVRQMGLSGLQQNKPDFAPIEAHARKQYEQKTLPGIMERLTNMGAQGTSALAESLAGGSKDLETSLAAMRSQFDMQNRDQLMNMLGMGLAPRDEIGHFGGRQGFLGQAGAGLAQGFGKLLPIIGKTAFEKLFGGSKDSDESEEQGGSIEFGGPEGFGRSDSKKGGLSQILGKFLPVAGKAAVGGLKGGLPGAAAAISPDVINALIQLLGGSKRQQGGGPTKGPIKYSHDIPGQTFA